MTAQEISKILRRLADPQIAGHSQRFFKTGIGQYGEGDRFLGIRVPVLREQAKKFKNAPLGEVQSLLKSVCHEERLCALLLLVQKFSQGNPASQKAVYELYLKNTRYINNWDLVDLSAYRIVGPWLMDKDRQPLYTLARSKSLWERRIAIIATFHFIKNRQFDDTLEIAGLLLTDREDLMHKATGWMLREVGKRDCMVERNFLNAHYHQMPRTMLRYAIEKFPEDERSKYLKGLMTA
ncbi:MAG: DNA alkylation repair protein [Deltaproteobacteria bacterium HGW-Deltaproteobacteria-6]|nr:MAG: DNA alkylation repair protein [Deltaproteobacteria bacterium HGW-Deltaproteobacteria-6]